MIDMVSYFLSFFQSPSGSGVYLAIAVGLAVAFGAVWLTCYWPPLFKKPWLWAVLVGSAILTPVAISFIQIPLQIWTGRALNYFWSQETLMNWIHLAAIPSMLLTGLVQEGAKFVPVVVYWWRSGKRLDPKLGLVIGAIAGAGFAVLEAQWAHNQMIAYGWTWAWVQDYGFAALLGFLERFFTVAAHVAFSALAGYGLAKGWGWQFYLLVSFLHGLLNYGGVLYQAGHLTEIHVEIYIGVLSMAVTAWALWLRWRKGTPELEPEAATATETDAAATADTESSTP